MLRPLVILSAAEQMWHRKQVAETEASLFWCGGGPSLGIYSEVYTTSEAMEYMQVASWVGSDM